MHASPFQPAGVWGQRALPGETRVLGNGGHQLKYTASSPPVAGAMGVIGLGGRARFLQSTFWYEKPE